MGRITGLAQCIIARITQIVYRVEQRAVQIKDYNHCSFQIRCKGTKKNGKNEKKVNFFAFFGLKSCVIEKKSVILQRELKEGTPKRSPRRIEKTFIGDL